jgi:glycosyltransferase involved in cell wall biosynthesis
VKVYIDDQIFFMQRRGGISRYFVEMMLAFRANPAIGVTITGLPVDRSNLHLKDAGLGRRVPRGFGRFRSRAVTLMQDQSWKYPIPDVVHHTQYYVPNYLQRHKNVAKRVVTVYDMIPEIHPELFPNGNPHGFKQEFVAAADLVICISEVTKQHLMWIYGTPANKIVVIPLGVDMSVFKPDEEPHEGLPSRYVLFVGQRGGYKDFSTLARAFALADLPQEIKLVAVGGGDFTATEHSELHEIGISQRTVHLNLGDAELAGAYGNADCFVFPSTIEGFGLPTLEAMASGCPTILADIDTHREVGAAAAGYFAPRDSGELAQLLVDLTSNQELRLRMRREGLSRAASFTWNETAWKTGLAYADVLGRRHRDR